LGGCKKTESWIGSTVKIATEEATDITHNSVVLHGRLLSKGLVIEGDGPHRRYSFEVCDNDRFEDSAEYFYLDATSEDGETFSVDVGAYLAGYENKGLAMGAEYYYRARALLNGVKYQAFGEVRKFRTEVLPVEVSAGATDLGLGVNWGGCNLGAASPEDAGEYYAWAEVEPKGNYGTDTYRWKLFGKDADDPYSNKEGWSLSPSEDAARVLLGNQWHTPTKAEWKELMDNCEWIRAQRNGVYGFLVRSKKEVLEDRCIFLPAAGKKQHDTVEGMNSWGGYLSSTHGINSNCSIFIIYQALLSPLQDTGPVELGYSVRPVQIKAE
jgi:hypothetical protein